MNIPVDLRYTRKHEWLRMEADGTVTLGITDYAQDLLGDVIYVELPEVGTTFDGGDAIGVVESLEVTSEVYVPVAAKVLEINDVLIDEPELVNSDVYGQGWLIRIEILDQGAFEELMDAAKYEAFLAAK